MKIEAGYKEDYWLITKIESNQSNMKSTLKNLVLENLNHPVAFLLRNILWEVRFSDVAWQYQTSLKISHNSMIKLKSYWNFSRKKWEKSDLRADHPVQFIICDRDLFLCQMIIPLMILTLSSFDFKNLLNCLNYSRKQSGT